MQNKATIIIEGSQGRLESDYGFTVDICKNKKDYYKRTFPKIEIITSRTASSWPTITF